MCVISEKCWKSHPGWRGHRDGQWGFPAAGGFICDTQYNLGGKTWRGVIMMKDMLRIFFTSEIELSGIWITTLLRNEVGSGWGRTVRKLYTNGNNFALNFRPSDLDLARPDSHEGIRSGITNKYTGKLNSLHFTRGESPQTFNWILPIQFLWKLSCHSIL